MEKEEIIRLIRIELKSAEIKWPNYYSDIIHAVGLINEESGESIQAALDYVYAGGNKENIKNEVIQTAAMCFRLLINFDNLKSNQHFINE